MSYHRMKLAVGIFVIVLSLLFASLTYVILKEKGVFEKKVTFSAYTISAESLSIGMPVLYSGFEIGSIRNIELTERGQVHVVFEIMKEHSKWIRRNTVLQLEKPLIGSATINVLTSLKHPPLEPGSTLAVVVQDDINDIIMKIEPVVSNLQNIVASINTITEKIASEEGDFFLTLANLQRYSDKMVKDDALLTTLTGDTGTTESFKSTLKEVEHTAIELGSMARELHSNVVTPSSDTLKQLDAILADIAKKLETIEGTIKAIGSYDTDLIELKGDIRTGIQRTNNLLNRVNSMLGEPQPKEAPLP
jgi:phospholipid/cholesterol/gamma-HCH transport system substrate-binding protein